MFSRTKFELTSIWFSHLFIVVFGVACNESAFQESQAAGPAAIPRVVNLLNTDRVYNGGSLDVQSIDPISFTFKKNHIVNISEPSQTVFQPIDLVFAVDMSASTNKQISAIKDSIGTLVNSLSTRGFDLSVGLVGFVDSQASINSRTLRLRKIKDVNTNNQQMNISEFQRELSEIQNLGNTDVQEGGLLGIRNALQLLKTSQNSHAAKIVIYITDEVAHNGGQEGTHYDQFTRSCSVNYTADDIRMYVNSLVTPENFKLYYSAPLDNHYKVGGIGYSTRSRGYNKCSFDYPSQQMNALFGLTGNFGGELKNSAGRSAWPLDTSADLVTTIVSQLDRDNISNSVQNRCVLTDLKIIDRSDSSRLLHSYQENLQTAFANYMQSENLNLANIIQSKTLSRGSHNLSIEMNRCCIDPNNVNGNDTTCNDNSYLQKVNYQLNVK